MKLQTTLLFVWSCASNWSIGEKTDVQQEGFCEKSGDDVNCWSAKTFKLTRLDSELVGEVRDINTSYGRKLKIKTSCTKPLLFEIEDFLTEEECEHFIEEANKLGMESSQTYSDDVSERGIRVLDVNHDKSLSLDEMKLTIQNSYDIYPGEEDLLEMYKHINLDINNDNKISQKELSKIKPKDLSDYLKKFVKNKPARHSRYSKQAWLFPDRSTDEVFSRVQQRVAETVQLPLDLIKLSDFQVVNYGIDGHYNAHTDSSKPNKEDCCDLKKTGPRKQCRICRYMTVLFYLNDNYKGGETAFPVANNETLDLQRLMLDNVGNLFEKCETANLKISAKRGKALIWYNHFMDETGWMGELDDYTFHGGCPVLDGEKWIANFWIKTTLDRKQDIKKMKKIGKKSDKYKKK